MLVTILRLLILLSIVPILGEEENWIRKVLKEEKSSKCVSSELIENLAKKKCNVSTSLIEDQSFEIYVFLSFSVPEETWLSLSAQLAKVNGTIVLQGLPKNSFKEFYKNIKNLDNKGFTAPLQINPMLFEEYNINQVPAFVIKNNNTYDKVSGNISLQAALELMAAKGDSINE